MFRVLCVAISALCLCGSAKAADLRGTIDPDAAFVLPPAPPPSAGFVWTGPYAGINAGFGGGGDQLDYHVTYLKDTIADGHPLQRTNGALGGLQIGYNYAFANRLIVGFEADIDGTSIGHDSSFTVETPCKTYIVGTTGRINYIGTVRGRLGYAFDRLMLYGTGGFAYADVSSTLDGGEYAKIIDTNASRLHEGYVYGGGVQVAFTSNLSLRAEYLRAEFDARSMLDTRDDYKTYRASERPSTNMVRVGLDYRLDLFPTFVPAPVRPPLIARY